MLVNDTTKGDGMLEGWGSRGRGKKPIVCIAQNLTVLVLCFDLLRSSSGAVALAHHEACVGSCRFSSKGTAHAVVRGCSMQRGSG